MSAKLLVSNKIMELIWMSNRSSQGIGMIQSELLLNLWMSLGPNSQEHMREWAHSNDFKLPICIRHLHETMKPSRDISNDKTVKLNNSERLNLIHRH